MNHLPLAGQRILVTRPEGPNEPLSGGLRALGARVLSAPVIRCTKPKSWARLDAALRNLDRYDAAAFASERAVESFFARGRVLGLCLTPPSKVFAVGPITARALRRRGWPARTAKIHRAEGLAAKMGEVRGWRILLPRAQEGREVLPQILRQKGAKVQAVSAYRTLPDAGSAKRIKKMTLSGRISAVAFTSGSTVENFLAQLPEATRRCLFKRAIAASIGPVTTAALMRRGISPAVEAPRATMASLCAAIARHFHAH